MAVPRILIVLATLLVLATVAGASQAGVPRGKFVPDLYEDEGRFTVEQKKEMMALIKVKMAEGVIDNEVVMAMMDSLIEEQYRQYSVPSARQLEAWYSYFIDPLLDLVEDLLAETIMAIMDKMDWNRVLGKVSDFKLPAIYAKLGAKTPRDFPINLDITQNLKAFDVALNVTSMRDQIFDVKVSNKDTLTASIGATVKKAKIGGAVSLSTADLKVGVRANSIVLNAEATADAVGINATLNGFVVPLNAKLKTDEFAMDLKIKSFSFEAAPYVLGIILFVVYCIMSLVVIRVHFVLLSMRAMLDTLVESGGQERLRFCAKCGKRNGSAAKYCHGFFCGHKLTNANDDDRADFADEDGGLASFPTGH